MASSVSSSKLLTNGRFFTQTSASTVAFQECMLTKEGKIAYIGSASSKELQSLAQDSQIIDLKGHVVLPGFIDGHTHFLMLGQSLQKLDLHGCKNLTEIRSRIKKFAEQNPDKPRLLCRGWLQSTLDGEVKAHMLEDLDVPEKNRPIFVESHDLHSCWLNQAAIEETGMQRLQDPKGGSISRDKNGNADGLVTEAAVLTIIWPHLSKAASMSEKIVALREGIRAYHENGVTGCIDMAMDENAWEVLLQLQKSGELKIRVAAHWIVLPGADEDERLRHVDKAIEMKNKFNDSTSPDLKVVGIKIICDGVVDGCTAALTEPYCHNGATPHPIWTAEMLGPVINKATEAGLQIAAHAIGDKAVNLAINALEKYGGKGRRHRIEHLELTRPEDAKRLGELEITASIQPVHSDPAILRAWTKLLGAERRKRAFAYKEFADGGVTLAIGSDAPTAPHPPLRNLYNATTRKSAIEPEAGDKPVNEHFKIGICEAIAAATKGVAYSYFAEERLGSLEVGKLADFTVVDMVFEANKLLEAKIKQTWADGNLVYQS